MSSMGFISHMLEKIVQIYKDGRRNGRARKRTIHDYGGCTILTILIY